VDSVTITGSVLSENWPKAASLLTEALQFPRFHPKDLQDLVDEIEADLVDARNSDSWLARSWFARSLFPGSPYGRNVLGTTADLGSITVEDVSAFYRTWFTNQGAVVGLLGAYDAGAGGDLARLAGQLPGSATEAPAFTVPAAPQGRKLVFVDKPGRTQVQYLMGHLGPALDDPEYPALVLANEAFGGGGFGAVLMQEIREKRGWSYGASSALRNQKQAAAFVIHYFPAAKDALDCLRLGLELWEKLAAEGITEAQLEYARSSWLNGAAFFTDTGAKRLSYEIRKRVLGSDPLSWMEGIRSATLDSVNAAARKFLHPQDAVIVVVGSTVKAPKKGKAEAQAAPALPDVKAGLDALLGKGAVTVVPYDRE
jgi:zinc protease